MTATQPPQTDAAPPEQLKQAGNARSSMLTLPIGAPCHVATELGILEKIVMIVRLLEIRKYTYFYVKCRFAVYKFM